LLALGEINRCKRDSDAFLSEDRTRREFGDAAEW
jgi:hypothetical protein